MEGDSGVDADRIKPLLQVCLNIKTCADEQEGKRIALELIEGLNTQLPR